jgi:hypothetical protein
VMDTLTLTEYHTAGLIYIITSHLG